MDMFMCCNIRKQTGIPESKPDEVWFACFHPPQTLEIPEYPVMTPLTSTEKQINRVTCRPDEFL